MNTVQTGVYERTQDYLRAKAVEVDPAFLAWQALPYEQRIVGVHELTRDIELRFLGARGQVEEVRDGLRALLATVLPDTAELQLAASVLDAYLAAPRAGVVR